MLGPKTENVIEGGTANQQAGGHIINSGVPIEAFVSALETKDSKIYALMDEKQALWDQLHAGDLARQKLEHDLDYLRQQRDELAARIANPMQAFAEHQQRGSQIENLLASVSLNQSIGANRITAALEGFNTLNYTELNVLLADIEREGLMQAANAAFARGLSAEDAIKWHDAARHYARAAALDPTFESVRKASEFAERSGDYGVALRFSDQLVDFARAEADPRQISAALNAHANIQVAQGKYCEAEAEYRQCLEIDRATIGEAHPGYAMLLSNLGNVVRDQGRAAEAEALLRHALKIGREVIGDDHSDYAGYLNNLAGAVCDQGRAAEAEAMLRQALKIDLATIGEDHPIYASHLGNLAATVYDQGRASEAEALFRKSLEIGSITIGTAHPAYAFRLNNLAGTVWDQGRAAEAGELYAQCLFILRSVFGDLHPDIQSVARNYLNLLRAQNPTAPEIAVLEALLIPEPEPTPPHISPFGERTLT